MGQGRNTMIIEERLAYLENEVMRLRAASGQYFSGDYPQDYPCAWSGPTPPALGNGTLISRYSLTGRICRVNIVLTMGSTTTYGTGAWTFTLPIQAQAGSLVQVGLGVATDATGTTRYPLFILLVAGATTITFIMPATAGGTVSNIDATTPFTWATTDTLRLQIDYEVQQ